RFKPRNEKAPRKSPRGFCFQSRLPLWGLRLSSGTTKGGGAALVLVSAFALGFFFSLLLRCSRLAMTGSFLAESRGARIKRPARDRKGYRAFGRVGKSRMTSLGARLASNRPQWASSGWRPPPTTASEIRQGASKAEK